MMRQVIFGLAGVAFVWSLWWAGAVFVLREGLTGWLAERREAGWQAEAQEIVIAGYPDRLELTLPALALADPSRGVAFNFPSLRISSAAWWPGFATLYFPEEAVTIAVPNGQSELRADAAQANLRLHASLSLQLAEMTVTAGAWSLRADVGDILAAEDLNMRMVQNAENQSTYSFRAGSEGFALGEAVRASLRVPENWPLSFETFVLEADVTFDRPWDLPAIEGARPQPREIDLKLAEASWGALLVRTSGSVTVDAVGMPEGSLSLQVRNWREVLTLAENAGVLPPRLRPQAERVLGALAGAGGNPDSIDVKLNLRDGMVALGFIPIAPAPALILR
ncbi:MAG: DUF2125 domain-containing protein [Pseudomonadota bacterium]